MDDIARMILLEVLSSQLSHLKYDELNLEKLDPLRVEVDDQIFRLLQAGKKI